MLNKLSTFLGLSAKSTIYTKGYRVSDIMMYDRKGSLQGSVRLSDLQRKHILNTQIGLICHIRINCKLNAAKELREWQLAFIKQLIL